MIGKPIPFDEREYRFHTLARVNFAKGLKARRFDDVFQHARDLQRNGGCSIADDNAAKKARMLRGGKQQGGSADIRADRMRPIEPKGVDQLHNELAHCRRSK